MNPEIDNGNIWVALVTRGTNLNSLLLPNDIGSQYPSPVLRLKKPLYCFKQSSRLWWKKIDDELHSLGFVPAIANTNLYSLNNTLLLLLYVNNIVIINKEFLVCTTMDCIISKLTNLFKMKDLGVFQQFLGFEIHRITETNMSGYMLYQKAYIKALVERFGLANAKPTNTPMDVNFRADNRIWKNNPLNESQTIWYQLIIGSFLYNILGTRLDIPSAVFALSCHCLKPTSGS